MGYDLDRTLFVTDLDFTLLRRDATVSEFTTALFTRMISEGVKLTYATARSHLTATRLAGSIGWRLPAASYGGTVVVDPRSGEPLQVRYTPARAVTALQDATANRNDVEPLLHTLEGGTDFIRWRRGHTSPGVRSFLKAREGDRRLAGIDSRSEVDGNFAFYVALIGEESALTEVLEEVRTELVGCETILSADPYQPDEFWLEVHSDEGTKAHAAERIAHLTGCDRLVAFGDNHNDIPIFLAADEGHAVSNAVDALKEIASSVIESCDDDAVARWLSANI